MFKPSALHMIARVDKQSQHQWSAFLHPKYAVLEHITLQLVIVSFTWCSHCCTVAQIFYNPPDYDLGC